MSSKSITPLHVTNLEIEDAIAKYNMDDTEEAYANLENSISLWIQDGGALLVPVYIGSIDSPVSDDEIGSQDFTFKGMSIAYEDDEGNDEEWITAYTNVDEADKELHCAYLLLSLEVLGNIVLDDETYSGVVINPDGDSLMLSTEFFKKHMMPRETA